MTTDDEGHAISYKVLRRGTPVRASDGVEIGAVRRVQENARENIFDGIVVDTPRGKVFVDAPEVDRIHERVVTLAIDAAAAETLPEAESVIARRFAHATTVRRAKRFGRGLREKWDRR